MLLESLKQMAELLPGCMKLMSFCCFDFFFFKVVSSVLDSMQNFKYTIFNEPKISTSVIP